MTRLRESAGVKAGGVLLLLALVFCAAYTGAHGLIGQEMQRENWQDSAFVRNSLRTKYEQLSTLLLADLALSQSESLDYSDRQFFQQARNQMATSLSPDQTNIRYQVRSDDGSQLIATNLVPDEEAFQPLHYGTITLSLAEARAEVLCQSLGLDESYRVSLPPPADADALSTLEPALKEAPVSYAVEVGILAPDHFSAADQLAAFYHFFYQKGLSPYNYFVLCAVCLMAAMGLFLFLLWGAGHRAGAADIATTWQERIPFDLYLAVFGAAAFISFVIAENLVFGLSISVYSNDPDMFMLEPLIWAICASACGLFITVALPIRTLVVRLKAGCLGRTTLIYRLVWWLWTLLRTFFFSLPVTWRGVGSFFLYLFISFLAREVPSLSYYYPIPVFLVDLAALGVLCWWLISFRRVRDGGQAIAGGNLNYRVDSGHMPHEIAEHAEALNNISRGLSTAMDEQMKSERFKAELITNVSHDLKTPLTSIINYVDLLKTTQQTDPAAQEYIQVLERKSMRLKKLTEDLVEASKAATGALTVNREKIGMGQLLEQALGEHKEKLEARQLTVVTTLPEGESYVYADGRHLWRVLDNLLSNCAKYTMDGTRVYIDLIRGHGQVTLSVKNVSKAPLNVSSDRLMERFVRGEASRTTDGSGLGLSIAKSLTELQGGTFQLVVDGDLFKAVLSLPQSIS